MANMSPVIEENNLDSDLTEQKKKKKKSQKLSTKGTVSRAKK